MVSYISSNSEILRFKSIGNDGFVKVCGNVSETIQDHCNTKAVYYYEEQYFFKSMDYHIPMVS